VYEKPVSNVCILHLQGALRDTSSEKPAPKAEGAAAAAAAATAAADKKKRGSIVLGSKDNEFELPDFIDVVRLLDLKKGDANLGAYAISRIDKTAKEASVRRGW